MRSPHYWTISVRRADGTISTHEHEFHSYLARHAWTRLPIIRGVVALGESMVIGMKALSSSTSQQMADLQVADATLVVETEAAEATSAVGISSPIPAHAATEELEEGPGLAGIALVLVIIASIAMSIGMFKLLPAFATSAFVSPHHTLPFVMLEGAIKISIFCAYTWAIGLSASGRGLYQYHAAEHKAINALENDVALTPNEVNECSRIHLRCGTAFMLWMFVLAIIVFGVIGTALGGIGLAGLIVTRIALWPLLAGLGYEVIRFAGKHSHNQLVRSILAPGLWMQRLTTKEPTAEQCEVSIAALERVKVLEDAHATDQANKEQEVLS